MRELKREEKYRWYVVYDVCVKSPSWLFLEPFQPGRLQIEALQKIKSKQEIIAMVNDFKLVLKEHTIDFEKNPLVQSYPEIKNEHIYLGLKKYIEYFEEELDKF